MIIGISGKKGHGKDTLALIIQFLIALKNQAVAEHQFLEYTSEHLQKLSGWQKKMFTAKVKEIVCLLIGCTMEQLEDQTFKEKELDEEWRIWYGYHYRVRNNSNLTGRVTNLHLSKEEAQEHLSIFTGGVPKEGYGIDTYILTPRLLMQLIGTECGRKIIHPNIWVNATMAEYYPNLDLETADKVLNWAKEKGIESWSNVDTIDVVPERYPNWIITDVRFPNEVKAIKDRGGLVFRIDRPSVGHTGNHESETSLDYIKPEDWDGYLNNLEGVEYLIDQVKILLHHYKII